jgi:hypothetical protein
MLVSSVPDGSEYDTAVPDMDGTIARALRLDHGARVMIRPDGYIGAIARLNDPAPLHAYTELFQP